MYDKNQEKEKWKPNQSINYLILLVCTLTQLPPPSFNSPKTPRPEKLIKRVTDDKGGEITLTVSSDFNIKEY